MSVIEKIFGDINTKEIKKLEKIVNKIEMLDKETQLLTDEELQAKTLEFKNRLKNGETLDDILIEAFAVCREADARVLGMKPFKVQLMGGIALHQGRIAEMKTGEGKTLVSTLPVYLNALEGKGVHVVTVNDYLAKRDAEWMGKVYNFLGLDIGCVVHGISDEERKAAYNADITYGTNNEFGFDYLKDNMVVEEEEMMQRGLNFAIVDEVDSILIDEARTPLIISGEGEKSTSLYKDANCFIETLNEKDYFVEEKDKQVSLTEDGISKCEKYFHIDNFADPEHMDINHHVMQALRAHTIMQKDIDYVVKDGEIVIVDEFTGRLMFGRRYSDGLHQAIEAKENVSVRSESKTLATITLQNYFRMYNKLAGMTGTAKTEEDEFREIYNMDVVVIPTNKEVIRKDLPDAVYGTEKEKFEAIVNKIVEVHKTGQPILVGTISIEKSELIADMLKKRGVKNFNVLNAKQHEKEAAIVAEAGRKDAITIATNMAGRGTDIVLGGDPEFLAKKELAKEYPSDIIAYATSNIPAKDQDIIKAQEKFKELKETYQNELTAEQDHVRKLGGLCIIGTERHESRRIDNQLRGRSGRQGDPGITQFYISLEDDLLRLFGGDRIKGVVDKFGVENGEAIESGMVSRSIENAQKKVEGRNFSARKYVLQYDNVMSKQREIIYSERRKVLSGENLKSYIQNMTEGIITDIVTPITIASKYPEEWDYAAINAKLKKICKDFNETCYNHEPITAEELIADILDEFKKIYNEKEIEVGEEIMRELERRILLQIVDTKWMNHIDAMEQLKNGIGLRGLGGQDPAGAYAEEGFAMFEEMIASIQEATVKACYNVTVQTTTTRKHIISGDLKEDFEDESKYFAAEVNIPVKEKIQEPIKRSTPKIRRNEPCPCGSGKKYKYCCGR